MSEPGPPLNLREKYAADRALADLKRETRLEKAALKDYWRGVLLPAATRLAAFVIGCLVLGHWVIVPFREAKMDRPQPYYAASSYYMEGDLTRAAESLKTILEKKPLASPANILMAKIEVSRGKPEAAIGHLKKARETTLDQKEIDAWIAALERTSSPGNIPHSP